MRRVQAGRLILVFVRRALLSLLSSNLHLPGVLLLTKPIIHSFIQISLIPRLHLPSVGPLGQAEGFAFSAYLA